MNSMSDYNDYIIDVRRGTHTETHIISLHLFNDWTQKVQVVRENVIYDIPEYAAVYARYNDITNETEIRFTWTTFEKGII